MKRMWDKDRVGDKDVGVGSIFTFSKQATYFQ